MARQRAWALAVLLLAMSGCSGSDAPPPLERPAPPDAGSPDGGGGTPDAGRPDAGAPDAGAPDAGPPDAGSPDSGTPSSGPERGAQLERLPLEAEGEADARDVDADAAGNAYLLVDSSGSTRFLGTPLPDDGSGRAQHALVKRDALGRVAWVRALPSGGCTTDCQEDGGEDRIYRLAVWPDGHVALAVTFQGSLVTPVGTFEGPTGGIEESPFTAVVLARLTPGGEWQWARELLAEEKVEAIDIEASGPFIALSGSFAGRSAQLRTEGNPGPGRLGGFVARFGAADGALQAAHTYWGGDRDTGFGRGVALAPDGRVWAVGYVLRQEEEAFRPYLVHLGADGNVAWERRRVGELQLFPEGLTLAGDGSLVMDAFANEGTLSWAGRTLHLERSGNGGALLSFGAGGEERWAAGLPALLQCTSVDARTSDAVTFVGRTLRPVDLGQGPRGEAGRSNVVVARFRMEDGALVWSEASASEERQLSTGCHHEVALTPGGSGEGFIAANVYGLYRLTPVR